MTDEMCKEYEDIDKLRMKCIALADKYCRKMYMGGILFSPKVNQARKQIEFWHLVTRKILGWGLRPCQLSLEHSTRKV
jgi:hypothetical protein